MDLLFVPVPLFDHNMAVKAYYFRYQEGNHLLKPTHVTTVYDGAGWSPLLTTLNELGIEAIAPDCPIFIPVTSMMLLSGLDKQCRQPTDRVVFVLDQNTRQGEEYVASIIRLRKYGYRFACRGIPPEQLGEFRQLIKLCDYFMVDQREVERRAHMELIQAVRKQYRGIELIATHIDELEAFQKLQGLGIELFDGSFYRTPILSQAKKGINPLKANLMHLLNAVQDPNFEFATVSDIIQRDTALSVSLLRLINSPYIGLSRKINNINQAVTLLGQNEVRKWVTTTVTRNLGSDKPSEVSKLSLMRARFAEELAPRFGIAGQSQSLFLMGLFSILDVILDVPMNEALELILVSDDIHSALVEHTGPFAPILELVKCYEVADWTQVARLAVYHDLTFEDLYQSYVKAISWYSTTLAPPRR